MRIDLVVHMVAGAVAIITGFIALFVAKGALTHRRAGMVFVYSMLTMSVLGAGMSAVRGVAPSANIPAGVLAFYFVLTGLVTVRAPAGWSRRFDAGLLVVVLAVGVANLSFAIRTVTSANAKIHWMAIPFFIFASIALIATVGDVRQIRAGGVHLMRGAPRIARHLWRMTFALLLAAFSFFIGQAKVIPQPYRIMPLLLIPPLTVLAALFYWLWRMRRKRVSTGDARILATVGA